jgi:hypothetical protein
MKLFAALAVAATASPVDWMMNTWWAEAQGIYAVAGKFYDMAHI